MQLLNHNINIKGVIYHVQTEFINRKKVNVVISQIFQEGEVIWSSKNIYSKDDKSDFKELMTDSHKKAIKHLKTVFSDDGIELNILKLNNIIVDFKDKFGRGIFFIELFKKSNGTLIAGYNQNSFATEVYNTLYKEFQTRFSLTDIETSLFNYIYFELSDEFTLLIGNLKNTDIAVSFLIDSKKLGLGMFLNAIYPKFISMIKKEIKK